MIWWNSIVKPLNRMIDPVRTPIATQLHHRSPLKPLTCQTMTPGDNQFDKRQALHEFPQRGNSECKMR